MKRISLFTSLSLFALPVLAAQAFNVQSLISALVYLVIVGLIFWLVWWFIGYVGIPEPFNKVIRVIVGLIALLILIYFLLSFVGGPSFSLK